MDSYTHHCWDYIDLRDCRDYLGMQNCWGCSDWHSYLAVPECVYVPKLRVLFPQHFLLSNPVIDPINRLYINRKRRAVIVLNREIMIF